MVAYPNLSRLTLRRVYPRVAPFGALIAGACVAALFALVPAMTLEDWVWRSGVPALVPAAAAPLGMTARAVLALAGGALAASVVWSLLYLLVGPGGLLAPRTPANAVPVVRRADAHPDAPPRRPMTAADLGTPLMEVAPAPVAPPVDPVVAAVTDRIAPFERAVPTNLDQPLSAFDPAAIPDVPLPAPVLVASPSRHALAPGERIDTYVLTPPPPAAPIAPVAQPAAPRAAPGAKPSIDALLARLEAHAAGPGRRVAAR